MKKEIIQTIIRISLSIVILIGIWKETESFWLMSFCIIMTVFVELSFMNGNYQRIINKELMKSIDILKKGVLSNHDTINVIVKAIQKLKKVEKAVPPENGGCWFCYKKDDNMAFDTEFDTNVHIECIKKALEGDPNHLEAKFMKYLLEG